MRDGLSHLVPVRGAIALIQKQVLISSRPRDAFLGIQCDVNYQSGFQGIHGGLQYICNGEYKSTIHVSMHICLP